jgi:peptidoglycan L-alanyl-D-glutamate endopeptidase CwlK
MMRPMDATPDLLTPRDRERMAGVHAALVRVVERARRAEAFFVIEGLRSPDRQKQLLAQGRSRTLQSRHLTGHAVDLGPMPLDWANRGAFRAVAAAMQRAADEMDVRIRWGGSFRGFFDGPHFELDARDFPP